MMGSAVGSRTMAERADHIRSLEDRSLVRCLVGHSLTRCCCTKASNWTKWSYRRTDNRPELKFETEKRKITNKFEIDAKY